MCGRLVGRKQAITKELFLQFLLKHPFSIRIESKRANKTKILTKNKTVERQIERKAFVKWAGFSFGFHSVFCYFIWHLLVRMYLCWTLLICISFHFNQMCCTVLFRAAKVISGTVERRKKCVLFIEFVYCCEFSNPIGIISAQKKISHCIQKLMRLTAIRNRKLTKAVCGKNCSAATTNRVDPYWTMERLWSKWKWS